MFDTIDAKLGPLSCLVNNAGVVDVPCRVDAMDVARLQRMFATNVISAFVCAREAVKRMSTRHGGAGGSIVNVSSRAAGAAGAHATPRHCAGGSPGDCLADGR
jgi:NAD(P)-dependent dehydrogenase (short-subunit alcohol dehydrogenase family)